MKVPRITRNLILLPLLAFGIWGIMSLSSCDGGPSTGNGGGGVMREFSSPELAGNGASFSHVFATAKSVPYYCSHHGGPGGSGMSGVVTVNAGGSPSKTNISITSSTLPDVTIDVGDTIIWTNNHSGVTHNVRSDN